MGVLKDKIKLAGLFIILGMAAGVLSIAPAVDSPDYLTEAAARATQVSLAALFQFALFLTYVGFAILIYPSVKKYDKTLALGFYSFRITAGVILVLGTVMLLSVLVLSQEYVKTSSENQAYWSQWDICSGPPGIVSTIFLWSSFLGWAT